MFPLIALPFLILLLLVSYRCLFRKDPRLPPSPFRLPIVGNLHQLGPLLHRYLLSLSQKHGPLMLIHIGQVPTVVVSSADAAREVLKTHDLAFASRPISKVTRILAYGPRNISFCPYGDYWRQAKKTAVVHLLNPKRVQSLRAVREEAAALMVERVSSCAAPATVELSDILHAYSNGVASHSAVGKGSEESRSRERAEEEAALFDGFQLFDLFPSMGWLSKLAGLDAKLDGLARRRDALFNAMLEVHAAKRMGEDISGGEDFMDVLLALAKDGTGGFLLSQDDIKAIVFVMLLVPNTLPLHPSSSHSPPPFFVLRQI